MFAGGVTVGDTLVIGHFHILDQPSLYERLRAFRSYEINAPCQKELQA